MMSDAGVIKSFIDGILFAIIGYIVVEAIQNRRFK